MFVPRAILASACFLALAGGAVGCGGGSDSDGNDAAVAEDRPAPPKSDFPAADGRSLIEIVKSADAAAEQVVSPAALVFQQGSNRYPFGVFNIDGTPVSDAEIALYISKGPPAKASGDGEAGASERKGALARARKEALDAPALGPFPAGIESMATKPAYRAQSTSADPDASGVVYVADLDFASDGEWQVAALIREGDEVRGSLMPSATVGRFEDVPRVGERPPKINTPTAADVGGDLAQITTRVPPDTQNRVDFADVLGKQPVVLLFATPQFCESRVCGPVVDIAEQVKDEHDGGVNFIHMEIFEDNDPGEDVRPQVRAFELPSEPWLFAFDRDGVVRKRFEGAFGLNAMNEAVAAAGR